MTAQGTILEHRRVENSRRGDDWFLELVYHDGFLLKRSLGRRPLDAWWYPLKPLGEDSPKRILGRAGGNRFWPG